MIFSLLDLELLDKSECNGINVIKDINRLSPIQRYLSFREISMTQPIWKNYKNIKMSA